jgi:pyocin large subunit-like protein
MVSKNREAPVSKTSWQTWSLMTAMTLGLVATGCGAIHPMPAAMAPMAPSTLQRTFDTGNATEKAFRAEVAKRGISLSDAQFSQIRTERMTMPIGTFANRPANNLTAEQNLQVHFQKHCKEFGIKTEQDYLKAAVAHSGGKNGPINFYFDMTSFDKGYQTHVVRWNPKTREFGATRADGAVTTYYKNNSVEAKRFVPVPAF